MNAQLTKIHAALNSGGWKPGVIKGDKFRSICPACGARHNGNPTKLAIGAGERGGLVVNCFAGCGGLEVVAALGLKPEILFPPKMLGGKPGRAWIPAEYAIDGLADDALTIAVLAALVAAGQELTERQRDELASARVRIESVLKLVSRSGK